MYSENDLEAIDRESLHMHECIETSKLAVIPNAGHSSPIEEPEAVTRVLMEFIANLDGEALNESEAR
jgi:pimeloyl-ACP methyl ester carboxylesterase